MMIATVRLPLSSLCWAYDINAQFSPKRHHQSGPGRSPARPVKATSMYQHYMAVSAPPYIRHKCRATHFVPRLLHCADIGRIAGEGGKLDSDGASLRIHVGLRRYNAQGAYSAQRGDPVVDRMCQRFLQIIAAGTCKLFDLASQEVVIPGEHRVVAISPRNMVQPDFHGHEQSLRNPDLELM